LVAGKAHMKTGSLNNVMAIAGYVLDHQGGVSRSFSLSIILKQVMHDPRLMRCLDGCMKDPKVSVVLVAYLQQIDINRREK